MQGLSGMNRSIDMDKHFKAREQIMKITEQQDKLHRGRAIADAMREAEELGNQYRHAPHWKQDLSKEQVNKRRHALKELVRTNRDPRQNVDAFFPRHMDRPVPPEQRAAATMRGADPTLYAPTRRQAPQLGGMATPRIRSAPSVGAPSRASPAQRAPTAPAGSAATSVSSRRLRRGLQRRLTDGTPA